MKEETIALFKQKGERLQLVKITKEDIGTDNIPTDLTTSYFQIRLNRSRKFTTTDENKARTRYLGYIANLINQLTIF